MNILYNALLFYSRIRVPKTVVCTAETLNKAYRYLPLVGQIVGLIAAAVFLFFQHLCLPIEACILLAMATLMLSTGALHEDGLADFADGFGAGRDREAILRIMKDSHIGTYGVLTLILSLLLKYTLLAALPAEKLLQSLVLAQGASRFMALLVVYTSQYVLREGAKSAHNVVRLATKDLLIAAAIGLLPLAVLGWTTSLAYLLAAAVLFFFFRRYLERKIGGYTGDTLGALILLSELLFYIVVLATEMR